jgi:hypothetical protein
MKSAFLFRQILDSKEAAQRSGQISGQLGASASSPIKGAPMPRDSDARHPIPAAADARQPRKNRKATIIRHGNGAHSSNLLEQPMFAKSRGQPFDKTNSSPKTGHLE